MMEKGHKKEDLEKWWEKTIKADHVSRRALTIIDALKLPGLHERMFIFEDLKKFASDVGIILSFKELPESFKSSLFYYKGKPFILINSLLQEEGQWYLLGFELGHNILHIQNNINLPCFTEENYLNNPLSNAEANYFSQSLFLPRRLLFEWAKEENGDAEKILQKMVDYVQREIESRAGASIGERPLSLTRVRMINRLKIFNKYYSHKTIKNIDLLN